MATINKLFLLYYFSQSSLAFYLNFLFQLQPERERLVNQDLIFQSKQILNLLKQIIWLVNFWSTLFDEQKKFNFFNFWLALSGRWNQGDHLHFISHAHAFDVIRREFVEWALAFTEWESSLNLYWLSINLIKWNLLQGLKEFQFRFI